MVRIKPYNEEEEINRKLRHACPRIRRWKSRMDEADGDAHKIRELAINKSPVYVAIQRGSKNIMMRTPTTVKLWRKWIQQGVKYGFDDTPVTPIHIPAAVYRYQRKVSLTMKSPEKSSPRRSVPVSPVRSPLHSPVKVSFIRDDESTLRSPKKRSSPTKAVPMLTLTPVPLNQVLKRKARIVGNISTIGKGRWIDQDSSMLAVPGSQVYQYDSSTETEDEIEKNKLAKKLMKQQTPPSTTPSRRLTSAKQRDLVSPPKSPSSRSPSGSISSKDSDHEYSVRSERIIRKIRAAGQTSLLLSPTRIKSGDDEETMDETVNESDEESMPAVKDKSAVVKKMRAVGATTAAFSPIKSPPSDRVNEEEKVDYEEPRSSTLSTKEIKEKMRSIGATSIALTPHRIIEDYAEHGTDDELTTDESTQRHIIKQSRITSFMRKLRLIKRLSSIRPNREAELKRKKSIKAKIKFIGRFLKSNKSDANEEKPLHFGTLLRRIIVIAKLSPKKKEVSEEKKETNNKSIEDKNQKEGDDVHSDKVIERESFVKKAFTMLCPCISRNKEPELMEYLSGSQVMNY